MIVEGAGSETEAHDLFQSLVVQGLNIPLTEEATTQEADQGQENER
jgi:hypothetical protein